MKYPVVRAFICKLTKIQYAPRSVYEIDDDQRGKYLQSKGYVGPAIEEPPVDTKPPGAPEDELKHVGGGYYELPDGRRVRGREEALKAMDEQT